MHVIEGQMFVSATVQKPVFALRKIKVNIFSTQIDFTNLYVASLVYLSRKNMRLGPYSKAWLSKDVFFVCIFPQQKSQHNFLRTRI